LYSGNHESRVQHTNQNFVRLMTGINSQGFHWSVAPGEAFETPSAALTFSDRGLNGVSQHFHKFINDNVRAAHFSTSRPAHRVQQLGSDVF
jgi:alpha-galactosidase